MKSVTTAEQFFGIGTSFMESGLLLEFHPSRAQTLILPAVVCLAFATEAFLKCLIFIERGSYPHGHNLKGIFGQVSSASKRTIKGSWESMHLDGMKDGIRPDGKPMPRSFEQALEQSADAFIQWRYLSGNGAAWLLPNLLQSLNKGF